MATFISPLILFGFFAVLVGFIGKFIYDFQQSKKQTLTEPDFEYKDDFQKLAGIKPFSTASLNVPTNVTTKKLNEQIVEALLKAAENSEFPKSDESINVRTTKITTIDTNFGDNDPLATIPMSRVSKEGKKKMAQIAKEDIKITTEAKATKQMLESELGPVIDQLAKEVLAKPKRKYNKKPKQ
jgi:alanine-alpha-ketoisovalerate/valine-pyruvate aminotransferase